MFKVLKLLFVVFIVRIFTCDEVQEHTDVKLKYIIDKPLI